MESVTLQLPETLYFRLKQTAQAMKLLLETVLLRSVQIGSPPDWEDIPAPFQADIAALDKLDDATLWQMARSRQTPESMDRYEELLDKNAEGTLTPSDSIELAKLRKEADLFTLRKAHAAALLHWRGHIIPPSDKI